jgi:hypothetical protein
LLGLLIIPAMLAAQAYFPPGVLDSDYSKYLKALHEPSLWELSQKDMNAEVYRFLWIRSFHHPIAVRLTVRQGGSGWIDSRMATGQSGDAPRRLMRYGRSWLTKGKTQSLLTAFESAGFWNLPALEKTTDIRLDGARWVFEGVRGGKYHVVDRWSPYAGDPLRAAGLLALKLGRFRIRTQDIY